MSASLDHRPTMRHGEARAVGDAAEVAAVTRRVRRTEPGLPFPTRPGLAQRALAFSSVGSVASKAVTEAALAAMAAVTTPGPQASRICCPARSSPRAVRKRAAT